MTVIDAPTPTAPHRPPTQIAPDTWVINATQGEGQGPAVHLNMMVIRGREPIIVDTGVPTLADRYLADAFALVDPEDVRWVFLSHDDVDHYGNLDAVMAACPNATLLTSWFQWERMGNLPEIAPHRMRWIEAGDRFEANGRTYHAVRPPLYDSPTTRGLFDTGTGVYWASDCFATMVPHGLDDVAELPEQDWIDGCYVNAQQLSPWLSVVDPGRYHRTVEAVAGLAPTAIASCHSPSITGPNVDRAFRMLHEVVDVPAIPVPDQGLLDQIIAMAGGHRAGAAVEPAS